MHVGEPGALVIEQGGVWYLVANFSQAHIQSAGQGLLCCAAFRCPIRMCLWLPAQLLMGMRCCAPLVFCVEGCTILKSPMCSSSVSFCCCLPVFMPTPMHNTITTRARPSHTLSGNPICRMDHHRHRAYLSSAAHPLIPQSGLPPTAHPT